MLRAFSRRTVEGLKRYPLFKLMLPPFQSFLEINVKKEIEKDKQAILCAAKALQSQQPPDDTDVKNLLRQARDIDLDFLQQAQMFPISFNIHYEDIEPYRQQRIERLLDLSYNMLKQWQKTPRFSAAISKLYNEEQYCQRLNEILQLYAMETRGLSRSIRLPHLIGLAKDALVETIGTVMNQEARALAISLTRKVYQRQH